MANSWAENHLWSNILGVLIDAASSHHWLRKTSPEWTWSHGPRWSANGLRIAWSSPALASISLDQSGAWWVYWFLMISSWLTNGLLMVNRWLANWFIDGYLLAIVGFLVNNECLLMASWSAYDGGSWWLIASRFPYKISRCSSTEGVIHSPQFQNTPGFKPCIGRLLVQRERPSR